MTTRRLPAPQAQAFVVCRGIREQSDPYEVVLLGPKCHVPIPTFPAEVELSVYAHLLSVRILFYLLSQFILTGSREFLLGDQADLPEQAEPLTQMLAKTMVWAVIHGRVPHQSLIITWANLRSS
jgi:hypothetical protein